MKDTQGHSHSLSSTKEQDRGCHTEGYYLQEGECLGASPSVLERKNFAALSHKRQILATL